MSAASPSDPAPAVGATPTGQLPPLRVVEWLTSTLLAARCREDLPP